IYAVFFVSSRRRHTRFSRDWSSDVCSSDLKALEKIIKQRQVVVCEVPATKKNIIYHLGKHHGTAPPSIEALPFSCHFSERLVFRSEERRVGNECGSQWPTAQDKAI